MLRIAALIQGGVTLLTAAVLLLLRDPITDDLLDGNETLYWVLVIGIAGFGADFYARGFLAGRRQFRFYAALLVVEGASRLLFPVAVAVGIAEGVDAVALGIAVAPLACLAVLPFAFARHGALPPGDPAPDSGLEFTLARGGAFAAAVLLMMLSEQILINSGALFVRGALDAAAAGFIFNVMMVARAPLLLFQAVAASLLPHLTRLRTRGDTTGENAFRMSVDNTLLIIAGFAAAVVVGVLLIGPEVMQIAFGEKFTYDRAGLAIVAIGMGFYLSAAALNQAALAQGQARRAAACWGACAAGFVAFNLIQPLTRSARSRSASPSARPPSPASSTCSTAARTRSPRTRSPRARRGSSRRSWPARASSDYSHSIVAGGFELMSSATRLTWATSLMIRFETRSSRS